MRLEGQRARAAFLRRLNRFAVEVERDGRVLRAHLANSGRLTELLERGRHTILVAGKAPGRKTRYDLALVRYQGVWVSVDARKPGPLLAEAIAEGRLPEFAGYRLVRREPPVPEPGPGQGGEEHTVGPHGGRFDLLLEGPRGPCYVETKSVTLVEERRALFPDARARIGLAGTRRGAKHMRALASLAEQGTEAAVVFVVQRPDAEEFAPNWKSDPYFGWELVAARRAGVRVLACRARVTPYEVAILDTIPTVLV
jgi:sugar fermentation stimulation protein A